MGVCVCVCKVNNEVISLQTSVRLDVAAREAGGQALGELLGLLVVSHSKGVEVLGAADLELGALGALADLDKLGVGAARLLEEVADVVDGLGHDVGRVTEPTVGRGGGHGPESTWELTRRSQRAISTRTGWKRTHA